MALFNPSSSGTCLKRVRMRGSPPAWCTGPPGVPFSFSGVSTEEDAQEGSQVRATRLTLLGTPTLWTFFTPGDPDTFCSVTTPMGPKASASSPHPSGDLTSSSLSQPPPPPPPTQKLTPSALSLPGNRNHMHVPEDSSPPHRDRDNHWAAS